MKLTPRAGGERGSAAAPVLRAGESRGGSGLLRPRGWRGRGRCPCGSLASPRLGSAPPWDRPGGRGGRGGGAAAFPPAPALALRRGGRGAQGAFRPPLHSCHLPQPPRRREEGGLAPPASRFTYGVSTYDDSGGGSGREVPGAAAQPDSSGALGLPGCPPAEKWYRV